MVPEQRVKTCTYKVCHMVKECHEKRIPYTVCKMVPEQRVKTCTYQVCHIERSSASRPATTRCATWCPSNA